MNKNLGKIIISATLAAGLSALTACGHVNRTTLYHSRDNFNSDEPVVQAIGVSATSSVEDPWYGRFTYGLSVELEEPETSRGEIQYGELPMITTNGIPVTIDGEFGYREMSETNRVHLIPELRWTPFYICDYDTAIGPICGEWQLGVASDISITVRERSYDASVNIRDDAINPIETRSRFHDIDWFPGGSIDHRFFFTLTQYFDVGPISLFNQIRMDGDFDIGSILGAGIVWGRPEPNEENEE